MIADKDVVTGPGPYEPKPLAGTKYADSASSLNYTHHLAYFVPPSGLPAIGAPMYGTKDGGRSWQIAWTTTAADGMKAAVIKSNLLHFPPGQGPAAATLLDSHSPTATNYGPDLGVFPHQTVLPGKYYSTDEIYTTAGGTGKIAVTLCLGYYNYHRAFLLNAYDSDC